MIFGKYCLNKILKLIPSVSAFFNVVLEDFKLHMWLALLFYWTALIRIPSFWLPPDLPLRELLIMIRSDKREVEGTCLLSQLPHHGNLWNQIQGVMNLGWQMLTPGTLILGWVVQREKDCLEANLNMVSVAVCGPNCVAATHEGGLENQHNVHYRSIAGGRCRSRQRWHQPVWRQS